ncbi:MAG: ATP-binding cassette domain-containing protein [Geminicoccaceae bacterium]|nr:ATP-binding cassette domain-containing protein [Geminicoccaceae bacterium]
MAAVIEAHGLQRHFGGRSSWFGRSSPVRAVDGIDLAIEEGETFAIVGESGCGKSTLARVLAGLMPASAGSVSFRGRDLTTLDPAERKRLRRDMQFVFQDPFSSLNPRMTAGALIGEPLAAHDIGDATGRRRKVAELMARVGLRPEHASRYPHEFSGGQRQRIGIARALATGPSVIVGDEPVSALDVSIQAQVINLLEELKTEFGLTLVVISHDLTVIHHMADRVAVMYLGQIVELAPVRELFASPRHPYTAALLAAIPMDGRMPAQPLEGDPPNPLSPPSGCRFHTRCPHAVAACSADAPALEATEDGGGNRAVACHRARELSLRGADGGGRPPATAAARRFELYRRAREVPVMTGREHRS